MTLKDIDFSVAMYGTTPIIQSNYDVAYTGDESSINLRFAVTDEPELEGATAIVHLKFADSSHIERSLELTESVFSYTLKGTENKHAGVVRADIIITKGGAKFTRAGHKFKIDTSLDASVPLIEYAVDTLDTLVDGAEEWLLQTQIDFGIAQSQRADEWVADNDARADEFAESQTDRTSAFNASEASRTIGFNASETGRSNTFTVNENAREAAAESGEAARGESFELSEYERATTFGESEAVRVITFNGSEADRTIAFNLAEAARSEGYTEDHDRAGTDHTRAENDHDIALTDQENYDTLLTNLQETINDANENIAEFDVALQNGIVATNIAAELQNLEETYAPNIVSLTSQLADIITVNVKDYGAKGDGVTDDSVAIQTAIAAMPKTGGKLLFPPGTYIHGDGVSTGYSYTPVTVDGFANVPNPAEDTNIGRDIRFIFEDYTDLTISGYGAKIQSHDENGECRNNSIFTFINCDNLRIEGVKLDGRSQNRLPILSDYNDGSGKADRNNILIRFGKNITLQDVESNYSMMDGICLSGDATNQPKNIDFINCTCDYGYRQGLTLSSVRDVRVTGGSYSFSGVLRGIMPKSGIDIEADSYNTYGVTIEGSTFDSNFANGLVLSWRSSGITVKKCSFINTGVGSDADVTCVNNIVKENTFINCGVSFTQYGIEYRKNLFLFDKAFINDYFFDFPSTAKINGKIDIFEDNTILCDLANIANLPKKIIGGIRFIGTRELSFKRNVIKNVYNNKDNAENTIWLGAGVTSEDNQFIFDYAGSGIDLSKTIVSIYPKLIKRNTVIGYTNVQMVKYRDAIGASSDFRFSKSFGLTNQQNKLYKLSGLFSGTLRVVSLSGHAVEYILRYNGDAGSITCLQNSETTTSNFCNVYKKGTDIYIEPLDGNLVITVDFTVISPNLFLTPEDLTLVLESVETSATVTLVPRLLLVKSVSSKESITLPAPYTGYSVFDVSRNKHITWNGTVWVDGAGTTI